MNAPCTLLLYFVACGRDFHPTHPKKKNHANESVSNLCARNDSMVFFLTAFYFLASMRSRLLCVSLCHLRCVQPLSAHLTLKPKSSQSTTPKTSPFSGCVFAGVLPVHVVCIQHLNCECLRGTIWHKYTLNNGEQTRLGWAGVLQRQRGARLHAASTTMSSIDRVTCWCAACTNKCEFCAFVPEWSVRAQRDFSFESTR